MTVTEPSTSFFLNTLKPQPELTPISGITDPTRIEKSQAETALVVQMILSCSLFGPRDLHRPMNVLDRLFEIPNSEWLGDD